MDTNGTRVDRIPPWINYAIKDGDKPVYIGVYYRYVAAYWLQWSDLCHVPGPVNMHGKGPELATCHF
jgi:hypothetical protein